MASRTLRSLLLPFSSTRWKRRGSSVCVVRRYDTFCHCTTVDISFLPKP